MFSRVSPDSPNRNFRDLLVAKVDRTALARDPIAVAIAVAAVTTAVAVAAAVVEERVVVAAVVGQVLHPAVHDHLGLQPIPAQIALTNAV